MTTLGLSLVLISQTELLLSSNERTQERIFYAAESGLAVGTARVLYRGRHSPVTFSIAERPETVNGNRHRYDDQVSVTRVAALSSAPCDFCMSENGGPKFRVITHTIASRATRFAYGGSTNDQMPTARSTVSAMVSLQPWPGSGEAFATASGSRRLPSVATQLTGAPQGPRSFDTDESPGAARPDSASSLFSFRISNL